MRSTEGVIFAFGATGEPREATGLAQRADAIATACQNLVRIGLMPNVPNEFVGGRIENVMQGHGEFNNAKTRAQMTASDRHGVNHLGAHFVGKLTQIAFRQGAQIRRRRNAVQKGGQGFRAHSYLCRRGGNYLPRPQGGYLFAAVYNETRGLTQKVGLLVEQIKVLDGLIGQHPGLRTGAIDPQNGDKGGFSGLSVFAGGLAQR